MKKLLRMVLRLFHRKTRLRVLEVYDMNTKYRNFPIIHDFLDERKAIAECNGYRFSLIYNEQQSPTVAGEVKVYYQNKLQSTATLRMRDNNIIWYFNVKSHEQNSPENV